MQRKSKTPRDPKARRTLTTPSPAEPEPKPRSTKAKPRSTGARAAREAPTVTGRTTPSAADLSKLDPSLWNALKEADRSDDRSLHVFLRLDPDKPEAHSALLARVGIEEPLTGTSGPVAAVLSPSEVKSLSHEPAVEYIRLGRQLRPTEYDPT